MKSLQVMKFKKSNSGEFVRNNEPFHLSAFLDAKNKVIMLAFPVG